MRGYRHLLKGEKFYDLGIDHRRNLDPGGGTPGASAGMERPEVIGALTSKLSVAETHNKKGGDLISLLHRVR